MELARARRLVVKLGSSTVVDARAGARRDLLEALAHDVEALMSGPPRREIVVVSSGAIAMGWPRLGLKRRPSSLTAKQAAAAVGQGLLMSVYESIFSKLGRACAQVLLTADDLRSRTRFNLALRTLEQLMSRGVVPIVNENDTVAVEEIRFGDNDRLAAMVAILIEADLLVLLSDVDGLYSDDPRRSPSAQLIPFVADAQDVAHLVDGTRRTGPMGTGGVATKVAAARMASATGIPTVLAGASAGVLRRIVGGEHIGTFFAPSDKGLNGPKRWLAFYPRDTGTVIVDEGAARALRADGRSLLASGVVDVVGEFPEGSVVQVRAASGEPVGRGVARFSSEELRHVKGRRSADVAETLGRRLTSWEVIHRDQFVTAGAGIGGAGRPSRSQDARQERA